MYTKDQGPKSQNINKMPIFFLHCKNFFFFFFKVHITGENVSLSTLKYHVYVSVLLAIFL